MSHAKSSIQHRLFESESDSDGFSQECRTEETLRSKRLRALESNASEQKLRLAVIDRFDAELSHKFQNKLVVHKSLTRQLVSFQANKQRASYRWYKYKEAFSQPLIDFLFSCYNVSSGTILDPFAGAGTSLFAASDAGLNAEGIELLPIGQEIIRARILLRDLNPKHARVLESWLDSRKWKGHARTRHLPSLRITDGAYPAETIRQIEQFLSASQVELEPIRTILRFALLCVLEEISYTRKDGQYLRWDYRSGRRQGVKLFDKGTIGSFAEAILSKLNEIVDDTSAGEGHSDLFTGAKNHQGKIKLHPGSCLHVLSKLISNKYDAIITSPPYCNRYDYTRTYALELALLGIGEKTIGTLRQEMLSCTVENRAKDLISINSAWIHPIKKADEHQLLQAILDYLEWCRKSAILNNSGIVRMVRGYFYEMACVIAESNRVLKPGAVLIMVNDNVRYAGASVSVDLILSSLAESLGFTIEKILVLPQGKGNSSQQMGAHGRDALRKCVYVWRKEAPCPTAST